MSAPRTYRIVVIEGDGIGPELVAAAMRVLDAAQDTLGFRLQLDAREGGAGLYRRSGRNLAPGALEAIKSADAAMKGPVGLPEVRLPDGTEAGTLGGVLRIALDTYVNLRPVRSLPGVPAPIAGPIDYVIVRENTEGLYLSRGKGIGTDQAMADTLLITRKGTERVARYAFELARRRTGALEDGVKRVTCVDKSNVLASYAFFRRVFDGVGEAYPDIQRDYLYADAAAQALVLRPQRFDVLVMENFLGDILSDLGGATVGGIGLCPAGNIGDAHAYFEPIHGSAPDIAGRDQANPISQVLTAALMLEHLGERDAARLVRRAVASSLESGKLVIGRSGQPEGGTRRAGETIADALRALGEVRP
ncbi:MAG TPA: isocitrate/isopropylmalate dehydrogenase family protein [Burkholderiales bacterium]|nr:isocitrate/isopropylmalate dehydrogenase family protein [Burkholderiales bacterium]